MNKTILSVTAFLLSANVVNANNLNKVVTSPVNNILVRNENNINTNLKSERYDFQKWLIKEKIVGKTLVTLEEYNKINPKNKNSTITTTDLIVKSMPLSLQKYHIRVLKPNTVVTMDFSENRININLNENNIIDKIYIG